MPATDQVRVIHLRSPAGYYGAERVIVELIKTTRKIAGEPVEMGVAVIDNPKAAPFVEEIRKLGLECDILPGTPTKFSALYAFAKQLRKNRVQILHTHDYKSDFYGIVLKMMTRNIRLLATNHLWKYDTRREVIYAWLDSFLLRYYNQIIAVSGEIKDRMIRAGIPQSKIKIIRNGIEPIFSNVAPRSESTGPVRIMAMGSLTHTKGFDVLLRAVRMMIDEKESDITVHIFGEGPKRSELEHLVRGLGIENVVKMPGYSNDMQSIFSKADLFVLPSRHEGTPICLLEAMSAGIPIVASAVGGIPDLLMDGEEALLVPSEDPIILKEKLILLVRNKRLRASLSDKAQKRYQNDHSSEWMGEEYCNSYLKLALAERGGSV